MHFFLSGININDLTESIPTILFITFQLTFAGITALLISGSIVGMMKTSAWILFIIMVLIMVYVLIILDMYWLWLMELEALIRKRYGCT